MDEGAQGPAHLLFGLVFGPHLGAALAGGIGALLHQLGVFGGQGLPVGGAVLLLVEAVGLEGSQQLGQRLGPLGTGTGQLIGFVFALDAELGEVGAALVLLVLLGQVGLHVAQVLIELLVQLLEPAGLGAALVAGGLGRVAVLGKAGGQGREVGFGEPQQRGQLRGGPGAGGIGGQRGQRHGAGGQLADAFFGNRSRVRLR